MRLLAFPGNFEKILAQLRVPRTDAIFLEHGTGQEDRLRQWAHRVVSASMGVPIRDRGGVKGLTNLSNLNQGVSQMKQDGSL